MPKKVEECVKKVLANKDFKPFKGKTKEESAWAICQAQYKKDKEKECFVCEIDNEELFHEAVEKVIKDLNVPNLTKSNTELENYTENSEIKESQIAKEDLEKINKFALKPVKQSDVSIYTALLIDDRVTRNATQYSQEFQKMLLSLPVGEGNFVGSTFLLGQDSDHQEVAASQIGRVFDAWQVTDEGGHVGVMGKIYILKEGNEETITKIDSGVLKEVSIATKVELPICSICNQDIRECEHIKGQDGCYVKMSGKGFVGEVSLVAIPGSSQAKILKDEDKDKYIPMEAIENIIKEMHDMKQTLDKTNEKVNLITEVGSIAPSGHHSLSDLISEKIKEQFDAHFEADGTFKVAPQVDNAPDNKQVNIMVSEVLRKVSVDTEKANEKITKYAARYGLNTVEMPADPTPEFNQGMKSGDAYAATTILMKRVEILDANLAVIEGFIRFNVDRKNVTYAGGTDETQIEPMTRYLNEKISDILVRIYQMEGRFSLESEEKAALIEENTWLGVMADVIKIDNKEDMKKLFENMSLDQLKKTKASFTEKNAQLYGENKVIKEEKVDEPKAKSNISIMDFKIKS